MRSQPPATPTTTATTTASPIPATAPITHPRLGRSSAVTATATAIALALVRSGLRGAGLVADTLIAVVGWTITLSDLAHVISAEPLARTYFACGGAAWPEPCALTPLPRPAMLSAVKPSGQLGPAASAVQELPERVGPAFPILESKLHPPPMRAGIVPRTALVNRLSDARAARAAAIIAPAGYGKTTLLEQWSRQDGRASAWLSLDQHDNDPFVLLTYLSEALSRVIPVDAGIDGALAGWGPARGYQAVHRIAAALWAAERPVLLILDNVHALNERGSLDALAELMAHMPQGSTVAVAGRAEPALPLSRLRAQGQIVELTADDLALDLDEATRLLRGAGVDLPEDGIAELTERTEGWPAGIYLATLPLAAGEPVADTRPLVGGDDRLIAGYFQAELLPYLPDESVEFALRTSILERMSGPLCDAVLERTGSAAVLETLAASNLFVVPLDRRGEWYRYHRLLRDMLRTRLERRDPGSISGLCRRAAAWFEAASAPDEAVAYAQAAGDEDLTARLVGTHILEAYYSGQIGMTRRWIGWFENRSFERHPAIAVQGAWIMALTGEAEAAMRWGDAAERSPVDGPMPDGSPSKAGWVAMVRAVLARHGMDEMRADAARAVEGIAPGSAWWPTAALVSGYSYLFAGEIERADDRFTQTVAAGRTAQATAAVAVAAAERSLIAAESGDTAAAQALATLARETILTARLGDYNVAAVACAAAARVAILQDDRAGAQAYLAHAQLLRPMLTWAIPWFSVHVRLQLARTRLLMADAAGARNLLLEIDGILRRRPRLGGLVAQVEALRRQAQEMAADHAGASTLTVSELRLLPLLPTHLSFREIGERLFISTNTVKTQAISIYRKLGASSRSEAVERAVELHLLDPAMALRHFPR